MKRETESPGRTLLRVLRVREFAIVDDLEIAFEPGLNVVTGETGAGKTLVLQALSVALGGRVDGDAVRAGASEAVIEAVFEAPSADVQNLLNQGGFAPGTEVLIRRVVNKGGRTRSYINGSLASIGVLTSLAPFLVRVYGQHEHEALRRVETHGELLDGVAGLGSTVAEMGRRYAALVAARSTLKDIEEKCEAAGARSELLRFQSEELKRAAVGKGEMATLASERSRHLGAARLLEYSRGAEAALYSAEGAAVEVVGQAITQLRDMEGIDAEVRETRAVLEAALAQLEEASLWIGRYASRIESDPERLATIESRLGEISRLARKYDVPADTLSELCERIDAELGDMDLTDAALAEARQRFTAAEKEAAQWAGKLSVERRRAKKEIERRMDAELQTLGMAGAHFTVQFADQDAETRVVGPRGWDDVEFFLAPNAGEPARPLAKVASGGELSRIILGLKTLGTAGTPGATFMFDEVDAGIGGTVAEVVGRKLKALAAGGQVICVTHLPQIAAFADHHYAVHKENMAGRTVAIVRSLASDDQVAELARMLGGASIRREAREHAQQMLTAAGAASRP
jgi:DNA repair protein RecN (Recombination protein N)